MSDQRLIGAHLPVMHPARRETRPGRCSGCLARFAVDVRLPSPATCPDCGGDVVAAGEVEPGDAPPAVRRSASTARPVRPRSSRGGVRTRTPVISMAGPSLRWPAVERDPDPEADVKLRPATFGRPLPMRPDLSD